MTDALPQPNLSRRLRHTPLRDLVRGRVTGRLDVDRRLDASGLPAPAKELVRRVVRRARLWRLERVDVATELCSHFAEGLASGETVESLVASFGDERRAARMIGRAKRRGRPLPWRALVVGGWLLVALVAFYGVAAIYYFVGRPSPAVDYVARLNAPILAVPADQRGWPLYRQAILALYPRTANDAAEQRERRESELSKLLEAKPGTAKWPQLVEWLAKHGNTIELLRRAAARPAVGYVLGPAGSIRDPELRDHEPASYDTATTAEIPVMQVLLTHLNYMRRLCDVLKADAAAARAAGDRDRLMRDHLAMQGMADQLARDEFLITQLVAVGLRKYARHEIVRTLVEAPQLLNDGDLRDLAHHVSVPRTAGDLFRLAGERVGFYDAVQRTYTDDGEGDGRLTPAGLKNLSAWASLPAGPPGELAAAVGPAAMLLTESRKNAVQTYDAVMDLTEAQLHRPIREVDRRVVDRRLGSLKETRSAQIRHVLVNMMAPALSRLHVEGERTLGERDGLVIGIALELHRRRTGRYPGALEELAPSLLPMVPLDRITGGPVRYRVVEGKPIVYSVGDDLDDDGGRVPVNRSGVVAPHLAANWPADRAAAAIPDGDWLLYPNPPDPPIEAEDESGE